MRFWEALLIMKKAYPNLQPGKTLRGSQSISCQDFSTELHLMLVIAEDTRNSEQTGMTEVLIIVLETYTGR